MEDIIVFLNEYRPAVVTLHLLGVVAGMGGATVTDMLFFNFLSDFRISRKEADVMRAVSHLILTSLFVIFVTGIALYLSDAERYGDSPAFLAKMSLVAIVTLNGLLLHKYITPRMIRLSFITPDGGRKIISHRLRRAAFAMGAVSFTSWYGSFFIAMLKPYMETLSYASIMLAYGVVLFVAVAVSQGMEHHLHKASRNG